MNKWLLRTFIALSLCVFAAWGGAPEAATLKLTRAIRLPGVKGRFDHLAVDTKGKRLFVAALGNNTLEVIDLTSGKHLESIRGLDKPQGVLYLADSNLVAVASGDDGSLKFFDGRSYGVMKAIPELNDADNVRFDPTTKVVYAGYGEGALAIIDVAGMKQEGSIKLAGHPESFQLEKQGKRIFVNVPSAHHIAVIDRAKRSTVANWPLQKFQANFPMTLDETNHRLFVGCRKPPRLIAFDSKTGHELSDLPIDGDTDDLFYDEARRRVYISCGEGFVDVITASDSGTLSVRERISTRKGARTSLFSPELNEFYLAVPEAQGEEAEIRVFGISD